MTKTVKPTPESALSALTLGKEVSYKDTYSPELLQPVPRKLGRDAIGVDGSSLPFSGYDLWNGYELSWLNDKGKPQVAIIQCLVPYDSENLIESKSFKLYLNGFNQQQFASTKEVEQALVNDLSACAGKTVDVKVIKPSEFNRQTIYDLEGQCLDELDIEINQYQPQPDLLLTNEPHVQETVHSHLLKSNCLITHQPDWASIQISYTGKQICHEALLRYLVSFRQHNEFHEQCVERIFNDIKSLCKPEVLKVQAFYTRRGGLDINPMRYDKNTTSKPEFSTKRLARQ